WQRAETLGALINGVFLVALCVSIFLEAIQRLVEVQEVNQPFLVLVVGSLGLLSNIVGLFLFGHSHDHGEAAEEADGRHHGHEYEAGHEHIGDEETGRPRRLDPTHEDAPIYSLLPENVVHGLNPDDFREEGEWTRDPNRPLHPANMRREIIESGRNVRPGSKNGTQRRSFSQEHAHETTRLLGGEREDGQYDTLHSTHNHAKPQGEEDDGHGHGAGGHGGHGHGHGHGDLNMRGVFLHVLGDALGNVGVIGSALIIWLTHWPGRYYADPAISLIITCIILYTAIPLCKAASRMLLQAVPPGLSIDHISEDIESLPGVLSCHHMHVWQLSDTKLVASLHIKVGNEIKDEGSDRYMELAREVRSCLHAYGIHSSTIQPEFQPDATSTGTVTAAGSDRGDNDNNGDEGNAAGKKGANGSQAGSSKGSPNTAPADASCLLGCGEECSAATQCCD
ncbi:hypothetical protein KEM55_004139, partial [Ascosphaera atra]